MGLAWTRPEPAVLCLLIASIMASGCLTMSEEGSPLTVQVPRPSGGESGTLSDGAVALDVRFTGVLEFRDASGLLVQGVAMKSRANHAAGSSGSAVHLIDEQGFVPLVLSECPALGAGYPQSDRTCQGAGAWSGSYLAARLSGAFGAAPFWGRTLAAGSVSVDHVIVGESRSSVYLVSMTASGCAHLVLEGSGVGFRSEFVYLLMGIPEELVLCPDSALPHRVTMPQWGTFTLQSHQVGDGARLVASGVGADPSAADDAQATQPILKPLPWRDPYGPSNLSMPDAHKALKAHPGAGEWLAEHPNSMLYASGIERSGGGRLLRDQAAGEAGYAERLMAYRDSDGTALSAVVRKDWSALGETIAVVEWNVGRAATASQHNPTRIVGQAGLLADANETLGVAGRSVNVRMSLPNMGEAFGTGDRYFLIVRSPVEGSFLPLMVVYDTFTGHRLAFNVPADQAKALTGLTENDMRR